MSRAVYTIDPITVNNRRIDEVVIDDHYKVKHGGYIDDQTVLAIVRLLDGRKQLPEAVQDGFQYFSSLLVYESKNYRLVWLLEEHTIYLGVINVYRDDRRR